MRRTNLQAKHKSYVHLTPLNARIVRLSSTNVRARVYYEGTSKDISRIEYPGVPDICPGCQLVLGREPFRVEYIESTGVTGLYSMYASSLTDSSLFLLPALGDRREEFNWKTNFVNCFIDTEDETLRSTGPHLYLLYRFSKSIKFRDFEERLIHHPEVVKMHDVDKFHVMYVFKFPGELVEQFWLFQKGKYSHMDEAYKNQILDFHHAKANSDLQKILDRDQEKRLAIEDSLTIDKKDYKRVTISPDAELYDPPRMEKETYFNRYKVINPLAEDVEFDEKEV